MFTYRLIIWNDHRAREKWNKTATGYNPVQPNPEGKDKRRTFERCIFSTLAATFIHKMHAQTIADLEVLKNAFDGSDWLARNLPEPRIGNQDCHELAVKYGARGLSCFVVFVEYLGDGTYGCRCEQCHGFVTSSLEDAIRHQRCHHFDHRPFVCIPPSGTPW